MSTLAAPSSAELIRRSASSLARDAVAEMQTRYFWFGELPADHRAMVGLLVQAAVSNFADWLDNPAETPNVTSEVFAMAPREMARALSLQQTVDLVRAAVAAVEAGAVTLVEPDQQVRMHEAVLRYSREIAFAVASVYAQAAEQRGAWDARAEALLVDAIVRGDIDETVLSRASALGWPTVETTSVIVAQVAGDVLEDVHRRANRHGIPVLVGMYDDRVIVVVAQHEPMKAAQLLLADHVEHREPVVVGPEVASLAAAGQSAVTALSALNAARAWPTAPTLIRAEELLPERALCGDDAARIQLLEQVWRPLSTSNDDVLTTVQSFIESTGSIQGTARELFVHPNTVRYRLRRAIELTGCDALSMRGAFTLRIAIALGRLTV